MDKSKYVEKQVFQATLVIADDLLGRLETGEKVSADAIRNLKSALQRLKDKADGKKIEPVYKDAYQQELPFASGTITVKPAHPLPHIRPLPIMVGGPYEETVNGSTC